MTGVTTCGDLAADALVQLLTPYGIQIHWVEHAQTIPGSHFGDPEAGLTFNKLFARKDTPVHSVLHEACHYICMDEGRRRDLHTDAGGDYDEENAVCYLSILLANHIPGFSSEQMMHDMDNWGYTFRLGSARRWFEEDAEDAHSWLLSHSLIDQHSVPNNKLRMDK